MAHGKNTIAALYKCIMQMLAFSLLKDVENYDIDRSGYKHHLWLLSEQYPPVEENKRVHIIDSGSGPIRAAGDKGGAETGWLRGIVWENNWVTTQYPKLRFPETV